MSDTLTLDDLAEAAYLACCSLAPAPPRPTPWADLDERWKRTFRAQAAAVRDAVAARRLAQDVLPLEEAGTC